MKKIVKTSEAYVDLEGEIKDVLIAHYAKKYGVAKEMIQITYNEFDNSGHCCGVGGFTSLDVLVWEEATEVNKLKKKEKK